MEEGMTASAYYELGNQHRRRGDMQSAMNAYLEAMVLDPESPAAGAYDLLQEILAFRNKDMYNQ